MSSRKTTAPATPAAAQTAQASKAAPKTMGDYSGTAAGSPAEELNAQTTSAAAKTAAVTKPKKSSQPILVHPESSLDPPGVVDALLLRHLGVQTNLADYQTDDIDDLCTQLQSKANALAELCGYRSAGNTIRLTFANLTCAAGSR